MYPPSLWDSSHSSHAALLANNTNPSFNFITGRGEGEMENGKREKNNRLNECMKKKE